VTGRTPAALTAVGAATQEAWTPFIVSTPLPEMTGPSRTVSLDRAFSSASRSADDVWYSAVPSQTDPIQTPRAPRARAAAICRPLPIPPAARTGTSSPTASTTSGTSTMLAISPVWPPAS